MRIITPELNTIRIGHQGENGAVCVQINAADWPTLYGAGEFRLDHQRPSDPAGYPCEVSFDGQVVSWIVTASDVAIAGYGKAELVYKVNDVVAKSITYSTIIEASVDGSGDPPEPWESWVDEVLEARDEAVQAASDAHNDAVAAHDDAVAAAGSAGAAHDDAVAAHTDAQSAETDALKAEGYAVGEQNGTPVTSGSPYYQNNAKYYKEQAAAELANKADKVVGAVAGNLAMLDATGNLADSGISADLDETVSGVTIEFNSDESVPLKSALIKGKTAGLNQLLTTNSIAAYTGTGVTVTYTDNKITFAETGNGYRHAHYTSELIEGHKYLFRCSNATTTKAGATFTEMWIGPKTSRTDIYGDIALGANDIIFTAIRNTSLNAVKLFFSVYLNSESYDIELTNAQLIDLTLCGFTSDETASVDALKAAWLSKFGVPLPQYIPYNAGSIVSNNAVYQLCGRNLWDEEWELGGIDGSTGGNVTDSTKIRSKNYVRVISGETYYGKSTGTMGVRFYDANKLFLSTVNGTNRTFEIPSNAVFLRFQIADTTTYANDICINLSDASFNGQYEPYHDGGSITADSLNGFNDEVCDTQGLGDTVNRKVGLIDLGDQTFYRTTAYTNPIFFCILNDKKDYAALSLCARFTHYSDTSVVTFGANAPDKSYGMATNSGNEKVVLFRDDSYSDAATFKTAMSGVYLVYELATPTTDTTTPATLTTQKGYNLLRTVSGDIQSAPATLTLWKGLGAKIVKVLSDLGVI